jgi:hypothetical protein
MILVKTAVLAFVASVVLLTIPSAIGWWESPCPNYGNFPGKQAIGLARGMQGCYYVTPSGDGVDVTVAYASREKTIADNVADARTIDSIMWNQLPFTIDRIVQYPNAFAPGDAATDKIVASQQDLVTWFGARPVGVQQSLQSASDVPLATSATVARIVYPLAGVLALVAIGSALAAVAERRTRSILVPAGA